MTDVHPTLEACARAACVAAGLHEASWRDYLPEARAALNALADTRFTENPYLLDLLREIAADPKPTVEQVLAEHAWRSVLGSRSEHCACAWAGLNHPAHVADMLREAGLLQEDA